MLRKILVLVVSIAILGFLIPQRAFSQADESFRMQLESILFSFKNYRFSNVSIWQLKDIKDIRKIIKSRDEAESLGGDAKEVNADCLKNVDMAILQTIESEVRNGASAAATQRALIMRSLTPPPQAQFDCIFQYYVLRESPTTKIVKNVYIVTTRKADKEVLVPNTIIGMLLAYDDKGNIKGNVNNTSPNNIFTYPELKEFSLDPKEYRSSNMYGLIENAFLQGQVRDVTLEAQGIGTMISLFPPKVGVVKSLLERENVITSYDVQKFKRISEGQPLDMSDKFNELVISPDLISWRRYDYPMVVWGGDTPNDTLDRRTNLSLPKYGVELKYGIENINYPSFWSERITLSAVWQAVKLGIILPTNGYSSLSKDLFQAERRLTHGGFGLAGEIDFPISVIPKSGVFNANFGYVFGDAKEGPVERKLDPDTYVVDYSDNDHLVRFNAQLHYTFGVAIDDDYMLRFGLGGTMYIMEHWFNNVVENQDRINTIVYEKLKDETIGGVSGKMEFMARNVATPYGATVQYFDEALFANIWLQVPVIQNSFSIRLDAKGYFKAFADAPRAWENNSVFIPMARFIVNF